MELLLDICCLWAWAPVEVRKHWKLAETSLGSIKAISQRFCSCCTCFLFIFQLTFPSSVTGALVNIASMCCEEQGLCPFAARGVSPALEQ